MHENKFLIGSNENMIPNYPVELYKEVNLRSIRWPPESALIFEDGLMANHDYCDERGYTWEAFLEAYEEERKIIDRVSKKAKNAFQFDQLLDEEGEKIFLRGDSNLCGFELGAASATIAVSAFGCAPVSSCRHHPMRSNEPHPYVAFWSKKREAKRIVQASRDLRIGLGDYDIEGYIGLIAWARNLTDLLAFGNALYQADSGKR